MYEENPDGDVLILESKIWRLEKDLPYGNVLIG